MTGTNTKQVAHQILARQTAKKSPKCLTTTEKSSADEEQKMSETTTIQMCPSQLTI